MKKYLLKRWDKSLILILLIIMKTLVSITEAYVVGFTFNALIKLDKEKFLYYLLIDSSLYLLNLVLNYYTKIYKNYLNQLMINDIRENIVTNISKTSYINFYKNEIGSYISWLSNDIKRIEDEGFNAFWTLLKIIINSLFIIIAIFTFHWSIIILILISSLITILLPELLTSKIQNNSLLYSKAISSYISKNTNYLQGFDTLLTFNKLKLLLDVNKKGYLDIKNNYMRLMKTAVLANGLGALGNIFSQIGVLILSGFLVFKNIMQVGYLITLTSFSTDLFNMIPNIVQYLIQIKSSKPIFEKIENFEIESKNFYELENKKKSFNENLENICLENIFYSYDNKNNIIENFSYIFEKNKKYVLVGPSGSGKTTLLNILTLRLNDYKGTLKINGKDVKEIKQNDILDKIMYISQNPYIFTNTLKFNITLGDEFSEERVKEILKLVRLEKLIDEKEGIEYELKEGGNNLSGGQKQRIALARGLIRNKKILLLDEVTSSLDKENADIIEDIVLNDKGLTVITISHRVENEDYGKYDKVIKFPLK